MYYNFKWSITNINRREMMKIGRCMQYSMRGNYLLVAYNLSATLFVCTLGNINVNHIKGTRKLPFYQAHKVNDSISHVNLFITSYDLQFLVQYVPDDITIYNKSVFNRFQTKRVLIHNPTTQDFIQNIVQNVL